jgi:hypothetical protein
VVFLFDVSVVIAVVVVLDFAIDFLSFRASACTREVPVSRQTPARRAATAI